MSADGHIEIEVELNSEKAEKELDSLSKSLEKDTAQAAKKAESSVKQSVKQIEASAKQVSKQTENSAKQAGQEVKNTASSASKQVIDSAKKAEEEVKKSSKRVTEEEKKQYKEWEKTRESSKPESDPSKPYKESSEKATQYWTGAGSKIKSVVSTITAATGAGAVAAGTAAINAGKSFEAGMSEVQAISGASRKDLEALTNKAKEMGATTKFSATQASEGLKYMAMAGWNSQQMIDGLPGVMNLAAASGEDLGTVSDIVTDALTAMGLKASDSAHFADVLATAASSSNTNVAMMGETFKYAAPVAGALGYNIEDLAQAIGLMGNAGIKSSQAGTSLRSILTRLAKPPKDCANAMEDYGISIKNSDGSMKSLMEVMENMRDSLQGLPKDEQSAAAAALGGQEAMSGLLAIINASESDFDNLSKAIDNASGAAQDQADIMNDNLQGALYELGSAAESAGIELYDNIKNPAKKAVRAAATEIRSLSTTIKDNGIEAIIPEETITTVKNLGTTAKAVGAGGLKVLGGAAQFAGENIQTVLPVAASLLTVVKGYTVVKTISTAFAETQVAMAGASTGMTILGTVVKLFTGEALAATTATGLLSGAIEKEKGLGSGNKELAKAAEDLMKYEKSLQTTEKALDKSEKNLNAANKELTTYSDKFTTQTNYSDFLSNLDKLAKDAGIKAKKIPETVLENIKAGNYKAPTTGDGLKRLINLDGLIQQAQEAGIEIPQYLLQGISDGSINFQSAINQMNTLLDFSSAAEKAGISGKEIPEELAQSIMQGKISVDEAINQLLSGSGVASTTQAETLTKEKATKIKKNVEDIGNGKIKGINTSAYTSSLNTASQKAKSTKKEIEKNSKLKATNNSAAAKSTYKSVTDEGKKAVSTVKKTGKEIGKGGATSVASTTSQWKSAGSKNAKSYISGVASQKGAAQKAGKTLSTSAKTGASSGKAGFVSAGRNMAAGIASGIHSGTPFVTAAARSAVRAAVAAAKAAAKIKSPSRVMKNEVGKYLPLGMAAGIKDNTDSVVNASRAMCASALTASADELDIHSPSRKFKNIIGKNIPKGIAKGVRESKSELVGEMESVVNEALSAAQNASKSGKYSEIGSNLLSGLSTSLSTSKSRSSETIQEIIDQQQESLSNANQKKEEALQNKIDKLGSKKANKKRKAALKKRLKQMKAADKKQESQLKTAGEKAAAAYNDAFEKESTRITKIAEKSIQELSETYQTKYNDIKSKMDTLTEKQRSWGNVYDLKQNIADIKRYQTNLKALENKIPESMMDKILGMNMDEATAYMDWFQGMTSAEQKAYLNDWNTMYSSSETFSKNFFSDDFGKIQKEYQDKLKKATDDLQAEMNQIGTNIAKGLTAGMDSESRNLSKTMKKICANLVKTAKKQLKIKSPSRVFKRIGVYNIQGAEKGHEAEAPRLYRQVENVSETLAERFAKANLKVSLPDIAGRTQAALSRQVSKVSASIQPQLTAALAGDAGQTIYNGPEKIELVTNLDGREIARTSVPYIDAYLGNMAARKARGGV